MNLRRARNLWELLGLSGSRRRRDDPGHGAPPKPAPRVTAAVARTRPPMQQRYDDLVEEMKSRYGVRVRKWRTSSSGCAWIVKYDNGQEARLIEAPYPRGPMSCAVFLHEIGHHAIGFGVYRPRCLEEYHAWRYALDAMRDRGLNVTPAVERRMEESVLWAMDKARRRGLREWPAELLAYADRSRRRGSRT